MKLQTNVVGRFGKKTLVNNVVIEWSERGIGEVKDDKIAKEIIADHKNIYEEGKVPVPQKKAEVKKDDSKEIEELKRQINLLEDKLSTAKSDIATLTNVKEQLIKDVEAAANVEAKPVEGEPAKISEDDLKTIISILESNKDDLVEAVKADPDAFPTAEWEELNKKELQSYIVLKSF